MVNTDDGSHRFRKRHPLAHKNTGAKRPTKPEEILLVGRATGENSSDEEKRAEDTVAFALRRERCLTERKLKRTCTRDGD